MFPEDLSSLFEHTAFRVSIVGLLGLLVGSFLNVVIYPLPGMLMATWQRDSTTYLRLSAEQEPCFTYPQLNGGKFNLMA